ncbi:MAG: T9SS type A sorting domain-containing protein [Cryomorphaceae bacterium]|nr:T9SS type A sorting domain-containing protein [Cryomorphaceae bacterium]
MKNLVFLLFCSFTTVIHAQIADMFDTLDFESPYEYILLNSDSANLWQIGTPQKTWLNDATSGVNGIITDTVALYPSNNHSYFDLQIGYFNNPVFDFNCFVMFSHKMDSDTLHDGGYLTTSMDGGETWNDVFTPLDFGAYQLDNIDHEGNFYYQNYDTLCNGESGFSGRRNWETTFIGWTVYLVEPPTLNPPVIDTLLVRFNFISDSLDNQREGWLIDDIVLCTIRNSSIGENEPFVKSVYPNPSISGVTIAFLAIEPDVALEVYSNDGRLVFTEEYNAVQQIEYPNAFLVPGVYQFVVKTKNASEVHQVVVQR